MVPNSRIDLRNSINSCKTISTAPTSHFAFISSKKRSSLDSLQPPHLPSRILLTSRHPPPLHRRKPPRLGRLVSPTATRHSRSLDSSDTSSHPNTRDVLRPACHLPATLPTILSHCPPHRQHLRTLLPHPLGRLQLSPTPSSLASPMGSSPSPSNHAHLHSLHPLASEHHSRPTLSFYLNSSLATTSRRYYTSIWSLYCSFSANSHVFPIPLNDSHIALFLFNLAQHPPHARSILRIVAVLKYAFAYNNIRWKPDPRTSLVIRGIAKTAPPCNPLIR